MENQELNQQAFDKVVRHLLKQNAVSQLDDDEKTCAYRAPGGLMCAVGCLIPDSEYDFAFEGVDVSCVQARVGALEGIDLLLLTSLQRVHDDNDPDLWPRLLRNVAAQHGLTMPDLEPSP